MRFADRHTKEIFGFAIPEKAQEIADLRTLKKRSYAHLMLSTFKFSGGAHNPKNMNNFYLFLRQQIQYLQYRLYLLLSTCNFSANMARKLKKQTHFFVVSKTCSPEFLPESGCGKLVFAPGVVEEGVG